MSETDNVASRRAVVLAPGQGRTYPMGRISAIFVLVPGGVEHDFENRGDMRAGVLNLSIPGAFEQNMPSIAQWFIENPPETAGI
jgi:hypothetical protein